MRRVVGPAGTVLALAAILTISGCAAPRVCAEAASGPPAVALDATAWLRAHPGAALQACFASRCTRLTAATPTAILQAPARDTEGTYALTVSASGIALADESLHLADPTVSGSCGDARVAMTEHLILDALGRITEATPAPPGPPSTTGH